jgi:flavorubredoxin
MAAVDEIADDIFRINLALPDRQVTFSFFLVRADEPTLIETSYGALFDETREAVAKLVDPTTIRHILVPHFEGDECGGMNHFLGLAPRAQLLGSPIAARGSLLDFAVREPRAVDDGELIDLGGKRLRILLTPQVHQWDSLLAFEETTGTLFSSDLFMHPGPGPAIIEDDRTEAMVDFYRHSNLMPSMPHLHAALDKIEPLDVRRIACHHGSTIAGRVIPNYFRAIRENDVTGFGGRPS